MPSLALSFGMLTQKARGAVTSSDVLGPPLTTMDELGSGCEITRGGSSSRNGGLCPGSEDYSGLLLTRDTRSSDTSVVPLVEGSLELMTPRLLDSALSPRLFVHADISVAFAFERNLAGERRPDRFVAPELGQGEDDVSEIAVEGQGSRAKSQVGRIALSAGAGVAFTARILQRTVRIKPSLELLRQEVDLEGELRRVVKQREPAGSLDDFRQISLRASASEVQHGLGAGLEIEADSGRLGPFALSLFALARGYRFLGDLDYRLSDANEHGESVTWDFELEPWAWRAGAGIRFRWLPR